MKPLNTSQTDFAHLHVHTQYSLLDGAAKIEQIFDRCGQLGQSAVAITDHGNMFGVLEFCKAAVRHTDKNADFYEFMASDKPFKVKPIIGCELYLTADMDVRESESGRPPKLNHVVLLAKNQTGYHNLVKLVSLGFTRGFYYKPRIDRTLLKQHSEGLICLSACLAGELPQAILEGDLAKADAVAKAYKAIFGQDYYIELQDHNLKAQKSVLPHLVEIARKNNIKLVCTNDVHYITRADSAMQKVLQGISFRRTLNPDDLEKDGDALFSGEAEDGYFPTREFYVKSREEMQQIFSFAEDALQNTLEIADKCDCRYFAKKQLLPRYKPETGEQPAAFLRRLTREGLERNYKISLQDPAAAEMVKRADYELSVIERMGFVDYFLIVWDFIYFAEKNGIPVGPGRGSGVGSIVAYALGITKPDPLKYGLLFERFLNPDRVSSPDFDIDFCVHRRDEVIEYVVDKYGAENVSQIITFGTLAAKAAVKDVGRVFNHPYAEVDKITKQMPFLMGKLKLSDLIGDSPAAIADLKALYQNDSAAKRIIDMAVKIEGLPRQSGIHAAGVIICRDPITCHIPLASSADGVVTTQFNMNECEELGLLKMDFLGLKTLTDIKDALDIIYVTRGETVDFYTMEYADAAVFGLIGEGDTHAVFQLESPGMKRFMRELKPSVFEDIIAGVALYRPGPMDNIDAYVAGKRNPLRAVYDHPLLEPILNVTYGIMVYQEQVMEAVRVLAGYTLARADELRRMISKKKTALMDKERKVFVHGNVRMNIAGAVANGVSETTANKIFDDIIKFADYAFNKSHATAYAYLAYQTAYLKRYYTVEYITAVLNNRITSIDEITNYLRYLKEKGIKVLPPDINQSRERFTVENGSVRIGMAAIKNVGAGVVAEIVAERETGGAYIDFENFIARMLSRLTLNKRMLESLIFSGAFDCFGNPRAQLMQVFEGVLARAAKDRDAKARGQFSFFDTIAEAGAKIAYPEVAEFSLSEKLKNEKLYAGIYLSGHPLDEHAAFLNGFTYNSSHFRRGPDSAESAENAENAENAESGETSVQTLSDGCFAALGGMLTSVEKRFTKNGRELAILQVEDLHGTLEVLASGHTLNKYRALLVKDKLISLKGKVRMRDDGISLWAEEITQFGSEPSAASSRIHLYISHTDTPLIDELKEILSAYPGDSEVFIRSTQDKKLYPLHIRAGVCELLIAELQGLVGADNIKQL